MTQTTGTPVGSLILEERVSTSADAELYLGRQPALDRWVSVRKLPADRLGDSAAVERFLRDAKLGARVLHPNLIQVFDCFALRGEYYMVLEQLDGTDLAALCAGPPRIPRRVALSIALEIARGLAALHARRIVHCALTPDRVRIGRWGDVKLVDLGRARDLDDGSTLPPVDPGPYTAPELADCAAADARSDLYSLGAILRELLAGEPHSGTGRRLGGIDPRLTRFAMRCLSLNPSDRPTARDAVRRLGALVRGGASEECRAEIAAWLWETRLDRGSEERPARAERRAAAAREWSLAGLSRLRALARLAGARLRARGRLDLLPRLGQLVDRRTLERAWMPTALAAGIGVGALFFALADGDAGDPEGAAPPPVSAASAAGGPRAAVSFVVYPWAEVSIETGPTFLTPRAAPVELAPGRYEIALEHPRFGAVHRTIEVAAGETRVVRHVFDQVYR
jgi:hypothetical protein